MDVSVGSLAAAASASLSHYICSADDTNFVKISLTSLMLCSCLMAKWIVTGIADKTLTVSLQNE
jgi:hypothetical protein